MTEVNISYDKEAILKDLEEANSLENNDKAFDKMSNLLSAKKQLKDALDDLESVESEIKGFINSKAKALYGDSWQVIKGEHYKISRSFTGDVYELSSDKVNSKFIKVSIKPNTDAIKLYIKENSKLPTNISYSPKRGESIRITLNDNSKA